MSYAIWNERFMKTLAGNRPINVHSPVPPPCGKCGEFILGINESRTSVFSRRYWCAILIAHQMLWQYMEAPVSIFQESPLAGEPRERLFHIHSTHRYQLCAKYFLLVYFIVANERLQPLTTTWYNSLVLSFSSLKI